MSQYAIRYWKNGVTFQARSRFVRYPGPLDQLAKLPTWKIVEGDDLTKKYCPTDNSNFYLEANERENYKAMTGWSTFHEALL